jgi:hypothetical protein
MLMKEATKMLDTLVALKKLPLSRSPTVGLCCLLPTLLMTLWRE